MEKPTTHPTFSEKCPLCKNTAVIVGMATPYEFLYYKFFMYLKKGLGFAVIKKELKRISVVNKDGEAIEEKGNMDVEIAIDAMLHFEKYNMAVFFTGDSDFLALVTYLRNHGKKVFIFSSKNNVSEELRTGADGYTEILDIEGIWGKELKHRAELEKRT